MTSQTSRYGIKYPTGGDLVSDIPSHMQHAAQSIERALANVDDRHTTAAYSPVVRPTFSLLNQVRPQPGQIGIVTGDNAIYKGTYIYDGTNWGQFGPRNITSMITGVMDNDRFRVSSLSAILESKLLHLSFSVTRIGGAFASMSESAIMTLPNALQLGVFQWAQIEPRFGMYVTCGGSSYEIRLGKATEISRTMNQNQKIDFSFTLQVGIK